MDFVADLRAPPTAAAELACTPRGELLGRVMDAARTLARGQQRRLERAAQRLDRAAGLVSPAQRLEHQRERLNSLGFRLASAWSAPQRAQRARRLLAQRLEHRKPDTRRAAERVANAARQLGQAHARLRLQARNRLVAAGAQLRALDQAIRWRGDMRLPATRRDASCAMPPACSPDRRWSCVSRAAARRPKSPRSGRSPTRPEQDAWSGPQAPGSTVSCKANTCCEKRLLVRRRPAGRWNDRNAGLPFRARTPPRRASRSRCPGGQRGAGAAPPPPVARKDPARDCDCQSPYRDYPKAETPEARALFEAARANDEAAFTAALAGVPHPGDYADDGRPLLHVLLMPPRGLRSKHVYWDMPKDEAARLRDEHRAALPARTRMLAALLATKPALNDATYQSRRTALQLALLYGSPQIVDMLLAAGADPNQAGDEGRKPLEFLLDRDFEFAVRMTYLPRLVDRPDMARMVQALLKAARSGPSRGWTTPSRAARALTDAAGEPRRMADFLSWNPLVELTEGGDVLRAFAATGTRPAFDNELSPLALAAYTGNAGAVPALMELVPRTVPATGYGEKGVRDVWLDAAQAAVIGGHPEIAVQLLQAGMPYAQRGPLTGSSNPLFLRVEGGDRPIMNLAAQRGDTVTLRRLVELGAPVEGDAGERHGNTPLAEAVARRRPEAARILLAAGADPALQRDNYDSRSALEQAVTAGDTALLRELLKAARPDTLQALMRHPTRSPVLLALKQPGADGLAMLRLWVDAGFDLKTLDADAIRQAVSSRNEALAIYLIDAGVPVNPRPPAAAGGDGASQDHADEPPLLAAAILRQDAIVDRLLARAQTRPAWPRTGRARCTG